MSRFSRRVAIGDPQAPLATFFAVLDQHGLRAEDGRLAPDVMLVSMGDHFDWGTAAQSSLAADDGLLLLEWLAAHDDDQVVLIAGNHDLGRVGELAAFDDATFTQVRDEALAIYRDGQVDREAERAFLERWPALPTAEIAARDFGAFRAAQRELVTTLLRQGRFRLAWAPSDEVLLLHAGVTDPQLRGLDIDPGSGARAIADALARCLDDAVRAWPGPPTRLEIPGVHRPGGAITGEGDGMLYHRAAFEQKPRRFDPRELPRGVVQAIGHIRDKKSRTLLGETWTDGAAPEDGPLRHLVTDGRDVRYRRGLPAQIDGSRATMVFLDGGMNHTDPARYEILNVDALVSLAATRGP